jgi:peptidoglycan hydrolase-like protein with peptidoglycan-binding domain
MRKVLYWVVALSMGVLAWSADPPPAKKKTPAKKSTAKSSSGKKAPAKSTWRNRQTVPSPERYKEIQAALASKGYLAQDSVNGKWGDASVEALKKFQADQKITASGKINSLSLIALGLGPKRDAPAPDPAAPNR